MAPQVRQTPSPASLQEVDIPDATKSQLVAVFGTLDGMASAAAASGVRLLVDAEQTYFQPAIDLLVRELQKKHNGKGVVVYNTIQGYLKDSRFVMPRLVWWPCCLLFVVVAVVVFVLCCCCHCCCCCQVCPCISVGTVLPECCRHRLEGSMHDASAAGYKLGVKLVRGAYMVQERELAGKQGYPRWVPRASRIHAMRSQQCVSVCNCARMSMCLCLCLYVCTCVRALLPSRSARTIRAVATSVSGDFGGFVVLVKLFVGSR